MTSLAPRSRSRRSLFLALLVATSAFLLALTPLAGSALALAAVRPAHGSAVAAPGVPSPIRHAHAVEQGDDVVHVEVLDAITGLPVRGLRVHRRERGNTDIVAAEFDDSGTLVVRRHHDARWRRVLDMPAEDGGDGTLQLSRRADTLACIIADGYLPAAFFPDATCPDEVVVFLEPAARLEVRWTGLPLYERPNITPWFTTYFPLLEEGERIDATTVRFEALPAGPARLRESARVRSQGLTYGAEADVELRAGETASVTLDFTPVAADLDLVVRMEATHAAMQPPKRARLRIGDGPDAEERRVDLRFVGADGDASLYSPADPISVVPGPLHVEVLPHARTFTREVEPLEPTVWTVHIEPVATCSVQVWDVVNDRPYVGAVYVLDADVAARMQDCEPLFGSGLHFAHDWIDRLHVDEAGRAECPMPNVDLRIVCDPDTLVVSGALGDFPAGAERPRMLTIDVRPLSGLHVHDANPTGFTASRWWLADDLGREVPAATRLRPASMMGMAYSSDYAAFDAEGPLWLVRRAQEERGLPERWFRVVLARDEMTLAVMTAE